MADPAGVAVLVRHGLHAGVDRELVANAGHKYVVASYTPGLVYNPDGSLTIHLAPEQPDGVPFANWLPIPRRNFNVMLRVYGPEGSQASNQYAPPAIERTR